MPLKGTSTPKALRAEEVIKSTIRRQQLPLIKPSSDTKGVQEPFEKPE